MSDLGGGMNGDNWSTEYVDIYISSDNNKENLNKLKSKNEKNINNISFSLYLNMLLPDSQCHMRLHL